MSDLNVQEIDGKKFVYVDSEDKWIPVIFEPLPGPQMEFLSSSEDYVMYGGARGGGKTDCLLAQAARYGHLSHYKALVLRREFPRLADLIDRASKRLPLMGWKKSENVFNHTSGALIRFGHCQYANDVNKYLSHEYHQILIDQAEEFTEKMMHDLATTCRSTDPNLPARIILTANPGGRGHIWLKKMFVEKCPPKPRGPRQFNEEFNVWWQPEMPGEKYIDEDGLSFQYIPAKVFDNKYLIDNDKVYVRRLKKLPEEKKKAHLDGNWDVFVGQYFAEFDLEVHRIEGFTPPYTWRRYISLDFGSDAPFVALFHTVDPVSGELFTYKEYSARGKHLQYHAYEVARYIKDEPHIDEIIYPHDMHRRIGREDADFKPMIEMFEIYLREALESYGKKM
jgi:phage terminase large subunit